MKKRKSPMSLLLCLLLPVVLLLSGWGPYTPPSKNLSLNVALYGYVPDTERFENAVSSAWSKSHPNISLNFISWDCYDEDPADTLDVFVFDSIFLSEFIEKGYLLPIPEKKITNKKDLLSFAMDGCTVNGKIYAIPQIVCTNLLYTRKSDTELSSVKDIVTLHEKIGDRVLQTEIPEENEGLLIDMSGGTTKVCMYLDALIDVNQEYTDYYVTPDLNNISEESIASLRLLQAMGGKAQVNYWPDDNNAYIRADWFREGKGRAYIGYTEAMSTMGDFVNDINFTLFSYTKNKNIPVFYGDIVGINSKICKEKQNLAFELANVITNTDTMVKALSPDAKNQYPQYLLPARYSVYDRLGKTYPIYKKLKNIVIQPDNHLFKIGPNSRQFISDAKKVIPKLLDTYTIIFEELDKAS
ncbi:MAG: Thiamine pyridinylase [Lachnoclostridium sp.]|jgi:thiamine pyridinylase